MAETPSPPSRRPTVDEWGVYDPQQAGLAALYVRLATPAPQAPDADAVTEKSPAQGIAESPTPPERQPR